ncbi:MAG TPA: hypothetical protein VGD79_11140 [Thermoanaerobaculia bacterium]|jgi:hypothetical protein
MRSTYRIFITAVLIVALAMPAAAASGSSSRPGGIFEAVKRFVVRAWTRVSPPVGCPDTDTDDSSTTTDTPAKTQSND